MANEITFAEMWEQLKNKSPENREMLEKAEKNAAAWIVCPMCDEPKCVGRFNCPEIAAWIEEKKRREENGT